MKTAKLGAMFLISILALAGIGVGYASWTDTITITGTVNTGNVDLVVVGYSGTWVWKDTVTDELIETDSDVLPNANCIPVASAWAEAGAKDDEVTVTFKDLFPCIDFKANILFHYDGSIPVKIRADFTPSGDAALLALWASGEAWIGWYRSDKDGKQGALIPDPNGIQLHECDYILVVGHIHLPQLDSLMGVSGSFTATFEVIQWNKY